MEGKRGSECLLKPVSNIDFNPKQKEAKQAKIARDKATRQIQYYSQIIPHEDIDTPEKLAEWLDDDEW